MFVGRIATVSDGPGQSVTLSKRGGGLIIKAPSVEGTYVRTHLEEESPWTLVHLYRGPIRIFSNQSSTLEGGLALMEDKVKEQVADLELGMMFVLCRNSTPPPLNTHIPNITVFAHQDHRMEVATGKFAQQTGRGRRHQAGDSMSFL
jgi:hypothetical protein